VIAGEEDNGAKLNDVWTSTDGKDWVRVLKYASFDERDSTAAVSFNNRIYIMGGQTTTLMNDVWSSETGLKWDLETD